MMAALERLNVERAAEAQEAGKPMIPLAVGIGLNSGHCVVGNMGSEQRFDYSVLGDPVNLAARLEGQSKNYGVDIVIGERTRELAPGWATLELDLIAVKGKAEAVHIFTLQGDAERAADDGFQSLAAAHEAMIAAYRAADDDAARAALATCAEAAPELDGLHALYADRIRELHVTPPPSDWDGVFVAKTK
jgi:adenylate cyclase